jgi:hypothetical protein
LNVCDTHALAYIRWNNNTLLARLLVSHTIDFEMTKDAPLAFRIETELKKKLLKLAKRETRSLSQICEMLLTIGVNEYEKEGREYLQKMPISARGARG